MQSEGFIFPICIYFIFFFFNLSSNRGPNRESKGINTFDPVKNKNMSILVFSPGGPFCCGGGGMGLVIIWTRLMASGKDRAGGWSCETKGKGEEWGLFMAVGGSFRGD